MTLYFEERRKVVLAPGMLVIIAVLHTSKTCMFTRPCLKMPKIGCVRRLCGLLCISLVFWNILGMCLYYDNLLCYQETTVMSVQYMVSLFITDKIHSLGVVNLLKLCMYYIQFNHIILYIIP